MHKGRSNQFLNLDILLCIFFICLQHKSFFWLSELRLACGLNQCWAALAAVTAESLIPGLFSLTSQKLQPYRLVIKRVKNVWQGTQCKTEVWVSDSVRFGWISHPPLRSFWHCLRLTKRGFTRVFETILLVLLRRELLFMVGSGLRCVATHPWYICCILLAIPAVIPGLKGSFLPCVIKVYGHLLKNRSKGCHQEGNILNKAL